MNEPTMLTATPDEVLTVVRELFPRELDIAVLTLTTRMQQRHIYELQEQLSRTIHTEPDESSSDPAIH
ncbi:hypothetical protein ACQEVF_57050 [Nonomuraea polychroma]|uniref:hypothetical protein n=1 Tax=Nonomuraea polychroma TaxID=46176 RepID=UPI003D946713